MNHPLAFTRSSLGILIIFVSSLSLSFQERWKHKEVSLDEVFKGCVLFLEAAMIEPETQVSYLINF